MDSEGLMTYRILRTGTVMIVAGGLSVGSFAGDRACAADVELKAITALPSVLETVKSFKMNFIEPVNEAGKGIVRVKYLGGPEISPPRKALSALQRGVVDMLNGPSGYYAGVTPEAYALIGSSRTAPEVRANGGMALLNEIWHEKAKAHIIAWADSGTQMHLYLNKKVNITPVGPDLSGLKMRTSATYIQFLKALGATPVSISAREIHTALERGVIDGFAWPSSEILGLGLQDQIAYRIDPSFYRINVLLIISLEKWNSLSEEARELLTEKGKEYERKSIAYMEEASAREQAVLTKHGMKVIALKDKAAETYLDTAYKVMWDRLAEQAPENAAKLREKFYRVD